MEMEKQNHELQPRIDYFQKDRFVVPRRAIHPEAREHLKRKL